jgi:CheY-like chemotaxis protein
MSHELPVLIAEDDDTNQRLLKLVLEREGYAPAVVSDGEALLREISRKRYPLVIMDLKMPKVDGMAALRTIRAGSCGPSAQEASIVIVSARALPEDVKAGLAAGADAYLTKPLRLEKLFGTLERMALKRSA